MPSDAIEISLLTATDLAVLDRVEADVFDYPVQRAVLYTWQLSSQATVANGGET